MEKNYSKGGVVRSQNTPGEPGSEIIVPIKLMIPSSIEDLESFIDRRVEMKFREMVRKCERSGHVK
ncbi:hypothetical protein M0R72_12190 [Candidatus Pacearchaeota archaeon]|jgi:hypothetical protein|nr:hypothetical protein [Candidatus Pacearchaeota archaeon]